MITLFICISPIWPRLLHTKHFFCDRVYSLVLLIQQKFISRSLNYTMQMTAFTSVLPHVVVPHTHGLRELSLSHHVAFQLAFFPPHFCHAKQQSPESFVLSQSGEGGPKDHHGRVGTICGCQYQEEWGDPVAQKANYRYILFPVQTGFFIITGSRSQNKQKHHLWVVKNSKAKDEL